LGEREINGLLYRCGAGHYRKAVAANFTLQLALVDLLDATVKLFGLKAAATIPILVISHFVLR
jgi:hypothetical protein